MVDRDVVYVNAPTHEVKYPNLWTPPVGEQRPQSVIVVIPPFTPVPEGGTEQVVLDLLKILRQQGCHVVVVATGDSQVDVAHVVLSPYAQAATKKQWYTAADGVPAFVNYDHWEYYALYYQTAEELICEYIESAAVKPDRLLFMYSNTFDRLFLGSLKRLQQQIACGVVWNTVFPQDPLQAGWWSEEREPYAPLIERQQWLGYSDEMARLRPAFMKNYLGSFPQPVGPEIFARPLPSEKDIDVFAATTVTPGKCVHLLIEACGRQSIQLKLAMRRPQGEVQQNYMDSFVQPALNRYQSVTYLGELSQADTLAYMARAKVCANPSLYVEPYGIANVQASALGAWIVAPGCGGFMDSVQDGRTGTLVPVAQGMSYHQIYQDQRLAEEYTKALAEAIARALLPGAIPSPEVIRENSRQQNSYEAVGPRLLALLRQIQPF